MRLPLRTSTMKCRAMPLDFAKLTLLDCRPLECNANNKKSSRGRRRVKKNEAPGAQGHRSFTTQYFHLRKDPNSTVSRRLCRGGRGLFKERRRADSQTLNNARPTRAESSPAEETRHLPHPSRRPAFPRSLGGQLGGQEAISLQTHWKQRARNGEGGIRTHGTGLISPQL